MIVVIVEDEGTVAARIERLVEKLLGENLTALRHFDDLEQALDYLQRTPIDLLLLDLNLHGKDGFDILANTVCGAYHTIIISAYADRAIKAFEYGVLDFVAKPFSTKRLQQALSRLTNQAASSQGQTRHLAIRKAGELEIVDIQDVFYIRGADNYSELVLSNGDVKLHDKSLTNLMMVLPERFERIHKSYIADLDNAVKILTHPGSKYELELNNGERLPIGRTRYKAILSRLA